MRLLVDNNLSPRLVDVPAKEGWDVAHVASLGLRSASDRAVLQAARDDGRGAGQRGHRLRHAARRLAEAGPSVVLVRRVIGRRVEQLAGVMVANLIRGSSATVRSKL